MGYRVGDSQSARPTHQVTQSCVSLGRQKNSAETVSENGSAKRPEALDDGCMVITQQIFQAFLKCPDQILPISGDTVEVVENSAAWPQELEQDLHSQWLVIQIMCQHSSRPDHQGDISPWKPSGNGAVA